MFRQSGGVRGLGLRDAGSRVGEFEFGLLRIGFVERLEFRVQGVVRMIGFIPYIRIAFKTKVKVAKAFSRLSSILNVDASPALSGRFRVGCRSLFRRQCGIDAQDERLFFPIVMCHVVCGSGVSSFCCGRLLSEAAVAAGMVVIDGSSGIVLC